MIDFGVVSSGLRPYVLDTRVKRGAELSTDHHLVSPVRRSFNSHLRQSFSHVPGEGTLSPNGPCSIPPLLRQLTGAVAVRWSVPVVVAIPKPAGGYQR